MRGFSPCRTAPSLPPMPFCSPSLRTLLLVLCLPLGAQAASLGLDASLNLLVLGDMKVQSSDVEGRVAVAGNAELSQYSVNTRTGHSALHEGLGLMVGGDLRVNGGYLGGDTRVMGDLRSAGGASFGGHLAVAGDLDAQGQWLSAAGVQVQGESRNLAAWQDPRPQRAAQGPQASLDFAAEALRLEALSDQLGSLLPSGSVHWRNGGWELDVARAEFVVFALDAAAAAQNLRIVNASAGSTVLINVAGQRIDFGNHGYDGFDSGRVLFNLPEAEQVLFNGGVAASFLAPEARFGSGWGVIHGQVVAGAWHSSVQVNDAAFAGRLPTLHHAVAAPASLLLALTGLALAAPFSPARRRTSRAGR